MVKPQISPRACRHPTHASVAQTKHQAPRPRAHLIDRPKLEQRLADAVASHRLTLVVAPAGWGKSTALSRQVAALPDDHVCAWVTADADDDLFRFVACLGAALEPLGLAWRVAPSALPVLARDERGIRSVVDEIVNAMAGMQTPRGVLVLDDMHRIADADVLALVGTLIDRLPASWGVVLASRREPPGLPVSRWRARGELIDLRQGDLQFDQLEVAALLRARGHDVTRATEWLQRTDGWVAGLHLLLSSAKASGHESLISGQRHVFDFLAEEVLDSMSPSMRCFLLRCSVLPELTERRCAHVSALPDARGLFEQLEREELFVTHLEGTEVTLRLHDLFRDFLSDRLQRDHPDELSTLLVRAAEQEDDLTRAVPWLLRAGEDARAARLLAERGPAMVTHGVTATLERLIESVPKATLHEHPEVHEVHGLCAYVLFRFEDVVQRMDAAIEAYAGFGRGGEATLARLYHAISLMNVNRFDEGCREIDALLAERHPGSLGGLVEYFGAWTCWARFDPAGVAPHFAAALDHLEAADNPADWEMIFFHSMFYGLPGMGPPLERLERALARLTGARASLLRVALMHHRAVHAMGQARVAEAAEWLARGDDDLRWLGQPRSLVTENHLLHLVIDAVRGDAQSCRQAARAMLDDLEDSGVGNRLCHRESGWTGEGRAYWTLGLNDELTRVARWLREGRNPYEWAHADAEQGMLEAMVALNEGRADLAEAKLARQLGPIEDLLFFRATTVYLLCAEAQRRQGKLDAAARTLTPWFDHVRQGGPAGGALLVGAAVLYALANTDWAGRIAAEDAALLRRLGDTAVEARSGTHDFAPGDMTSVARMFVQTTASSPGLEAALQAGLTEREAEVLAMISQGDSNKAIARKLDLSPFTVKRHAANIFDKLGLGSRTQAAAWWLSKQDRRCPGPGRCE